MFNTGSILTKFYDAVIKRDLATARTFLSDELVFVGLFETYPNADAYLAALTGLLSVTLRLDVKTIIAEGDQAAIFFELETKAPAAAITLVAEWHQFNNGKIVRVESAFDGRPFAAMFTGS
ncbi:MAG TPA: nuclear transport factor 2 family protein [Nitrosopumilaceae archaeon]|nr:nuclear transport factor 2 family protein [Nitrosopumilaceae archaeon]